MKQGLKEIITLIINNQSRKGTAKMKNLLTLLQLKRTEKSTNYDTNWALPGDKWEVILSSKTWDNIYHEKTQRQYGLGAYEGNPVEKGDLKIIRTDASIPGAIEYQVEKFNEDIEAGDARFSPVYQTTKKGPSHNTTIVVGGKAYQVETVSERDSGDVSKAHFIIGINGVHYTYSAQNYPGAFNEDGYVTRYAREAIARMEIRKANKLLKK